MRKAVLSLAVLTLAILGPGRSTPPTESIVNTASDPSDLPTLPELPVLRSEAPTPEPSAAPDDADDALEQTEFVPPPVRASVAPDGSSATIVIDGTSGPQSGSCSGGERSDSSSEDNGRVRHRHHDVDCPDDDSDECDEDPCGN